MRFDGVVVFVLLFVLVFALSSCSSSDSLSGFATHETYSSFSSPESRLDIVSHSFVDDVVYKTAYFSVNGSSWEELVLSGSSYLSSDSWLSSSASYSLPSSLSGPGEHYLIFYSCSLVAGSWDCHDNHWQLLVINNSLLSSLGTTFYVSNSVGNDSWSGLAPSWNGIDGPWKSLAKVSNFPYDDNRVIFQPGDFILFKRGDTWNTFDEGVGLYTWDSGSPGGQITYGAYSTGNKPIITGRHAIEGWTVPANWIQQSANIWYMETTMNPYGRYRVWLDGVEKRQSQSNTVTAEEPWAQMTDNRLYIYSSLNPATAFSNIESIGMHAANACVASAGASYITIQDLDLRGGAGSSITLDGGDGWIIEECDIGRDSGGSGIFINGVYSSSGHADNGIIRNNVLDTNDHLIDSWDSQNTEDGIHLRDGAHNWDIYNNTLIDWGHTAYCLIVYDDTYSVRDILFHDNYITAPDIDYGRGIGVDGLAGTMSGIVINNNIIYDTATRNQLNVPYLKFYNNIIDEVRGVPWSQGTGNGRGQGISIEGYYGVPQNMEIYNNIIRNCADAGIWFASWGDKNKQHNSIRNNIIENNDAIDNYQIRIERLDGTIDNTFQNNLLYKSGVTDLVYYGQDTVDNYPHTIDEFNAEDGTVGDVISDNIVGDPLFVDSTNSDYLLRDYHLQEGSPAIDAGVLIPGFNDDFVGSAPDIGVFESDYVSGPKTYYVSTSGDDANPGTFTQPFATWEKLGDVLQAGDTGYIRGGVYRDLKETSCTWIDSHCQQAYRNLFKNLHGTKENPINIWAYPGEIPIFNSSNVAFPNQPIYLVAVRNSSYLHFKGLRVTEGLQVASNPVIGWHLWESSNNIFENCVADHVGGRGFAVHGIRWDDVEDENTLPSANNLFLNCDAYAIADPLSSSPYGGGDCFSASWTAFTPNTTFIACRAWYCSDDGWDFLQNDGNVITIKDSWSFYNGYLETGERVGDGSGFKLGPETYDHQDEHLYTLTGSIAAANGNNGFDQNIMSGQYTSGMYFYNNFAYANYVGWMFYEDGKDAASILKNNVAFGNTNVDFACYNHLTGGSCTTPVSFEQNQNSWDAGLNVALDDFVSLDVSQLMRPRKADGSLPDIEFGHLAQGSDLIDAGILIPGYHCSSAGEQGDCVTWHGLAPDIGAFEYQG